MNTVVMGLGYIGLPTAALIASKGHHVHGVDVKDEVVTRVNQGRIHIVEPDLEGLVKVVVEKGHLHADTRPIDADVFLIAVPTPFKENHEPDLKYVEEATEAIIPHLKTGNLVILESTSPVGTTERIAKIIHRKRPELEGKIYIAYCPERVLPGKVIHELQQNDRAIGGIDQESSMKAQAFYSIFVKGNLYLTNAKTAEMCKLVENAYRDVNIAFANELSILCEKYEIDVWELIKLANKHPRVDILSPGCGVGGHCIAVDPWFIISENGDDAPLIRAGRLRNDFKADWVIEKIKDAAKTYEKLHHRPARIACMGLAFKPNIDDLRESPALSITKRLIDAGMTVMAVEPNIEKYPGMTIHQPLVAVEQSDIIVYLVNHREFKYILPYGKEVLDFCGVENGTRCH